MFLNVEIIILYLSVACCLMCYVIEKQYYIDFRLMVNIKIDLINFIKTDLVKYKIDLHNIY